MEGLELRILARFEADQDEVLQPGDMLYLPPGFAHHGVAVTPCLTYSVGFRAPSAGEAWTSFARAAASTPAAAELLTDPVFDAAAHPGAIPPALLARVRKLVRSIDRSGASIDRWFAAHATRLKPGHTFEAPRRAPGADVIVDRLARGGHVERSEEGRWAFLPAARGALRLYVGGEEIDVAREAAALAKLLSAARTHPAGTVANAARNAAGRALLARLFALGALRLVKTR